MFIPDYQTLKFEHHERIDHAQRARSISAARKAVRIERRIAREVARQTKRNARPQRDGRSPLAGLAHFQRRWA